MNQSGLLYGLSTLWTLQTNMRFSIITPTHKRADNLARAVQSLLQQTYTDWEMIIVNDSPHDRAYQHFASSINDARIHYHVNDTNKGVNYSRNRALAAVSSDSKWVLFLDDDDYFAPDTLATFAELITSHKNKKWFVTNRALVNGTPVTKFPRDNVSYSYAWSYLILKRCKGDATHCIETKLASSIRFSERIKQAEEWFFFYQVGLRSRMYYRDHNSTITEGYDAKGGLNFRKRTFGDQLETLSILFYEGIEKGLVYRPTFGIYIFLRMLKKIFF